MGLPTKNDLAGASATKTQVRTAMGLMWEYLAGLLGSQTPSTPLTGDEKATARESLGVGANGFKNRFINPAFSVSQEFASASTSVVAGAAIKYVVDQWYASCTGSNITAQRVVGVGDQKYSLQLMGSTSNTGALLGQRLESENVYDLKNKNSTVSVGIKASVAKTVSWVVYYASSEGNFTSKTQIATGTIEATSTLTNFQFTFNAGSNAGNGLAVEFTVSSLGASETITFDQMQIEKSSVATEFQARPIQQELALCQRYWENGYTRNQSGGGTGNHVAYCPFKVIKRATPTLTNDFSGSGSSVYFQQTPSIYGFEFGSTASGTGTSNCYGDWTANARL